MGHYRSEMISDEEYEREIVQRNERLTRKAKEIQESIDKNGLALALAKLLEGKY